MRDSAPFCISLLAIMFHQSLGSAIAVAAVDAVADVTVAVVAVAIAALAFSALGLCCAVLPALLIASSSSVIVNGASYGCV